MTMTIIICPECGAKNPLTASRCHQCDASLVEVEPIESIDLEDSDHFPSAEEDLPGLLNALKSDEGSPSPVEPDMEEPDEDQNKSTLDEDVPEWLQRIRKRAKEEKDAIGPITQKISAAAASLIEENKEMQRQNFESWIKQINEEAQDEQVESIDSMDEKDMPEWLEKIQQSQQTSGPENNEIAHERGENTMPMPDWIGSRDVEPLIGQPEGMDTEDESLQEIPEETVQMQTSSSVENKLEEEIGVISDSIHAIGPVLAVSPEEEIQADRFLAAIAAESIPKKSQEKSQGPRHRVQRIIFNLGLLLMMVIVAILGGRSQISGEILQPHNESVIDWAINLPARANILVVMDVQAGFYSEISMIAKPVIETVVNSEREIFVLSSTPVGKLLFNRMIDELTLDVEISSQDLGYFPVAAYGAFGLGGELTADWRIASIPQSEKELPIDDYDGILLLADSIVGAKAWVEQLSALMPNNNLFLFLTAQAGPMLYPYWDSGQVNGIISGISEAAGMEADLSQSNQVADRWHLYQIGIWLMVIVLVLSPMMVNHERDRGMVRGTNEPE